MIRIGILGVGAAMIAASLCGQSIAQEKPSANAGKGGRVVSKSYADVVATVNGEPITRVELAEELINTYGLKQLEVMINRKMIDQACALAEIKITPQEIEDELNSDLEKNHVPLKTFINEILAKQDMTYAQFMRDVLTPRVALGKLVAKRSIPTEEELARAFESRYGEKVRLKMLVVANLAKANEYWQMVQDEKDLKKREELFARLCKEYSIDQATRVRGGDCDPFGRHSSFPDIERAAFALRVGEISQIVEVNEGKAILMCTERIPAATGWTLDSLIDKDKKLTIREALSFELQKTKTRIEVEKLYRELREKTKPSNLLLEEFKQEAQKIDQSTNAVKPKK